MLKLDQIFGFVMNIPSECRLGFLWLPIKRRHWISIKNINGIYYNLDSRLHNPSQIGNVCCLAFSIYYLLLFYIINRSFCTVIAGRRSFQLFQKPITHQR